MQNETVKQQKQPAQVACRMAWLFSFSTLTFRFIHFWRLALDSLPDSSSAAALFFGGLPFLQQIGTGSDLRETGWSLGSASVWMGFDRFFTAPSQIGSKLPIGWSTSREREAGIMKLGGSEWSGIRSKLPIRWSTSCEREAGIKPGGRRCRESSIFWIAAAK